MVENGWKWLKIVKNGWKRLENVVKGLEMVAYGCK